MTWVEILDQSLIQSEVHDAGVNELMLMHDTCPLKRREALIVGGGNHHVLETFSTAFS
jgi:hypothetical protein